MKIPFTKMHGAANDFILVDDRAGTFPLGDRVWMARIAARRTGVGCEGLILIQPSEKADFRMRFINPDGGEVEMCGNGARCVARLAHDLGAAPARMTIETVAGLLGAEMRGAQVRLTMTPPKDWRLSFPLPLGPKETYTAHFVNTGVPHAMILVESLETVEVSRLGAGIRYHEAFRPAGTNANFARVEPDGALRVRTYERGVEAETKACGTGMVACGLLAARLGLVRLPVTVLPASGDRLEVDGRAEGDSYAAVTLTGPAEYVYEGTLSYP